MAGAPLPLLGTFHELSVAVSDVPAAVEFYERLGFTQATAGDTWHHPYGVLTDGTVFVGLHQRSGPSPVLTFVRSGVARQRCGAARRPASSSRVRRTGDEESSTRSVSTIRAARRSRCSRRAPTHRPTGMRASVSLCGEFAEVSLPAPDFAAAQAFWEPLGFVAAEAAEDALRARSP